MIVARASAARPTRASVNGDELHCGLGLHTVSGPFVKRGGRDAEAFQEGDATQRLQELIPQCLQSRNHLATLQAATAVGIKASFVRSKTLVTTVASSTVRMRNVALAIRGNEAAHFGETDQLTSRKSPGTAAAMAPSPTS